MKICKYTVEQLSSFAKAYATDFWNPIKNKQGQLLDKIQDKASSFSRVLALHTSHVIDLLQMIMWTDALCWRAIQWPKMVRQSYAKREDPFEVKIWLSVEAEEQRKKVIQATRLFVDKAYYLYGWALSYYVIKIKFLGLFCNPLKWYEQQYDKYKKVIIEEHTKSCLPEYQRIINEHSHYS